jgi:FlaA1/EpsC-like NDP-sugar epimerase
VLFHAAAYKHVFLCERSPFEAIQTNVIGVHNIARAAVENGVERLVFTSSDKAVNPTNVMGTSKLMGERLMTAAALDPNLKGATFLSTRFGNVLGSRGSVIPIFRDQIRGGGPVTLTDP